MSSAIAGASQRNAHKVLARSLLSLETKSNEMWMGRTNGSRLTVVALAAALLTMSSVCSGCIWLAIPGLAYSAYSYKSGGTQATHTKQHQSSQPTLDDVE
jgi:hypothetical protein